MRNLIYFDCCVFFDILLGVGDVWILGFEVIFRVFIGDLGKILLSCLVLNVSVFIYCVNLF